MAGPVPFKFEVAFKFAIGHTKGPSGSLISFEGHFAERCSAHWVHTPGRPAGSHGGAPASSLSLGRFERPGSMVASSIELHLAGAGPAAGGLQNTTVRGH